MSYDTIEWRDAYTVATSVTMVFARTLYTRRLDDTEHVTQFAMNHYRHAFVDGVNYHETDPVNAVMVIKTKRNAVRVEQ